MPYLAMRSCSSFLLLLLSSWLLLTCGCGRVREYWWPLDTGRRGAEVREREGWARRSREDRPGDMCLGRGETMSNCKGSVQKNIKK